MKNIACRAHADVLAGVLSIAVDAASERVDQMRPGADLMAKVNANVRDLADELLGTGTSVDLWGFRCECGGDECHEPVPLPLAQYEGLKRLGRPVLAPGHSLQPPPPA
jgi:hypothetical protein